MDQGPSFLTSETTEDVVIRTTFDQRIPTIFLNERVRFTLQIRHRGRQYLAQTHYVPTVPIAFLAAARSPR